MSRQLDLIKAVLDDLKSQVPDLATVDRTHTEVPFWFPPERSLAFWWNGELDPHDEDATGSTLMNEEYVLRYWEPSSWDEHTLERDAEAEEKIRLLFAEVRTRFLSYDSLTGRSQVASFLYVRGAPLHASAGQAGESGLVRGFEMRFLAKRYHAYS